ncbi:MAG: sigma-54 interaction domain-containing protein [Longimicrobiales bacterium]
MAELVLITTVDLEPAVRLRDAFEEDGFKVELLTAGERIGDVPDPKLLVLTGGLDQKQARRLVREAAEVDHFPIIALFDSVETASPDARRALGVTEAFVKPIDPAEVVLVARRLLERRRLREVTGIIGETDAMIEVLERVIQIAPVSSTVLVTGESGTGKERVARGIHALSPRRHRPFIPANVAALPETLLESELFGHEKGAFTGAVGQRKGFFELANRGTLFLDEIAEIPISTQTKLLRVLEEREFMRLGGEVPITVDVRFIAATNQNLRHLVELGAFRRDLYYRLNVLSIHLPPLRERRDDIPLLIEHFIHSTAQEHDRLQVRITPDAMQILIRYGWPGNVRELANLVESMVVLAPGTVIRPEDIPREIRESDGRTRVLPVHLPHTEIREVGASSPELEFVFRTLIQLRMDVEDLRHRFDEYRERHPELAHARSWDATLPPASILHPPIEDVPLADDLHDDEEEDEDHVIVYRAGMTLADLELAAITAALRDVKGNRRKAAEMLGMGERTLYRKIKEYGIAL